MSIQRKTAQRKPPQTQGRINFGVTHQVSDFHSRHNAGVTFAHKLKEPDESGRTFQQLPAKKYNSAIEYARGCVGMPDTYMGVNGVIPFRGRSNENTVSLTCNFIDADCHKIGLTPEQAFDKSISICEANGLPLPTLVFESGRGVYLFWLYEQPLYVGKKSKVSPRFKSRFTVTQELLIQLFEPVGADPACKDLARILRLVDTINSKSGLTVKAYDVGERVNPSTLNSRAIRAVIANYPQTVTPLPKPLIKKTDNPGFSEVIKPLPEPDLKPQRQTQHYTSKNQVTNMLNRRTLVYTRMDDLRKLAEMRGGKLTDHREMAIFYFAISAAVYCNTRDSLLREVRLFMYGSIQCGGKYDYRRPEKLLATVLRRHKETQQARIDGDLVTDLNYKAKNTTIIRNLEITAQEQAHLKTIISKDEKKGRHSKAESERRRGAGAVERAEYEGKAAERREKAIQLRTSGLKAAQIAEIMGTTQSAIYELFKQAKKHDFKN